MRRLYAALNILTVLLLWGNASAQDKPDGMTLLIEMEDVMIPGASQATIVQTIETSSGGTRDFTYVAYSGDGGEKSLMRYSSPSRVKNEAFLMLNNADDIWAYFARTRRIRKLASHARKKKIMGSDVTYEDIGGGKRYRKEYDPLRLRDEKYLDQLCFVLELKAKPGEEAGYERLVCYLRQTDYYPLRIDYYEKKEELLKTLYSEDIRIIEGHSTAMKMTMHNRQDDTKTIMVTKEITYDVSFGDDFFTERNLKP